MTRQIPEYLDFRGIRWILCSRPLATHARQFKFWFSSTSYKRGYKACWSIEEGRLYLVSIKGILEDLLPKEFASSDRPALEIPGPLPVKVEATVERMFPGSGGKAFAEWYTGELICNYGPVLESWRRVGEAADICENKLLIRVARGHIMAIGVVKFLSDLRWLFRRSGSTEDDYHRLSYDQ